MKKLVTFVLAAVTALSMTCTAFAAPSPTAVGSVSTTGATATDANGKSVVVTVKESTVATPSIDELKAADASYSADAKAIIESKDAAVIGAADISLPEGTAFPATITVKVAGVTPSTKLVVLHKVNGAWVEEKSSCGNGTVTIYDLTSCSPFIFVADKTTVAASTTTGSANGTSPKTGETAAIPAATLVCALAMAGVVLVSKKRRA